MVASAATTQFIKSMLYEVVTEPLDPECSLASSVADGLSHVRAWSGVASVSTDPMPSL